ncbi:CoA transferase [Microbacterium sp. NPDC076895]|uniref:CoA transferase n=1 Tax=Microbacterium sp. NPDC076895 TaxID=3154957 RepID=UPI003436E163
MSASFDQLTSELVSAATGRAELVAALRPPRGPVTLPSPLPVDELAVAAVGTASVAATSLAHARSAGREADAASLGPVVLDGPRLTAGYRSEQVFMWNGERPDAWAPASGFFETSDGWVRTHGNYPHHGAALRRMLGLEAEAGKDAIAAALRTATAAHWEDRAAAEGAIVGRVRNEEEWHAHPHAHAVRARPLVRRDVAETGAPRLTESTSPLPLAGLRVLDLTRVIAGPVATRTLGLFGAEVLRIDSPHLPEIEWQFLDTGQGKRSALLNLADPDSRDALHALLAQADVLVTGYRPGALARFGLDPASARERWPHLITATVDAWGPGPWEQRRGFDSIVQAVSGIAMLHGTDAAPGALPAQALDHTAGYLLAASVMSALEVRHLTGAVSHVGVSLARVAQTLLDAPRSPAPSSTPVSDETWREQTVELAVAGGGSIRCAAPAPVCDACPVEYPTKVASYGSSAAAW